MTNNQYLVCRTRWSDGSAMHSPSWELWTSENVHTRMDPEALPGLSLWLLSNELQVSVPLNVSEQAAELRPVSRLLRSARWYRRVQLFDPAGVLIETLAFPDMDVLPFTVSPELYARLPALEGPDLPVMR